MSSIGLMQQVPPYIKFSYEEEEDRDKSIEAGYYIPKNVGIATIIPHGGRDSVKRKVSDLIEIWKTAARDGRQPYEWVTHLESAYKAFVEGNELPEYGTPILTYLAFTPSQRQQLINANVRTLEECALMNEDTLARVGMGARELKETAKKALDTTNQVAEENKKLKDLLNMQQEMIEKMQAQLNDLVVPQKTKRKYNWKNKVSEEPEEPITQD